MSLDLSKLEKVRHREDGGVEARCPACAEGGHDRKGQHLLVKPDGRFGCCANPKDREHRRRIFALARDTSPRNIKVKTPAVKVLPAPIVSGVFGRLGRVFASPIKPEFPDASDGVNELRPDPALVRTLRTGESKSIPDSQSDSRTPRTPKYYLSLKEKSDRSKSIYLSGSAKASEPSENAVGLEFETGVRSVREVQYDADREGGKATPFFTPDGTLVIPFTSPVRYHWWKGGQTIAETRMEMAIINAIDHHHLDHREPLFP